MDIEQIEKGLEESSGIALSTFHLDQYAQYHRFDRTDDRFFGTVWGMIGAMFIESGMGGESNKQMTGNIGGALGQPLRDWLLQAHP